MYVAVWVDDMIIDATSNSLMNDIKELLKSKFKMTDLGMIKWFLGIKFDQTDTGISICQSHYLNSLLERFEMQDCKPRKTPSEQKLDNYEHPAENSAADVT